MEQFIEHGDYMPHGMCLLWEPWLLGLWAGSDLLIFLAYMAIPIALITVLKRRGDVPHRGLIVLFASFILLCGLTHLMGIVTLWYPIYPYVGALKLATGLVSAVTAVVLFRLIPTLVALPSPAHLREANERLSDEVAAHQETLSNLEATVDARTSELNTLNDRLAVQAREAVHRSRNLLSVVSSLASQSARGATSMDDFLEAFHGRVGSLADATSMMMATGETSVGDLRAIAEKQLEPLLCAYGDNVSIDGAPLAITPEAAQQLSLALHEMSTNAQKYNLSKNEEARVAIKWEVDEAQDLFVLTWDEHVPGGANVEFAAGEHEGFGTKLLHRIVPAMLRGEAKRTFSQEDHVYTLKAPVSAVLAPRDMVHGHGLAARLIDEKFGIA